MKRISVLLALSALCAAQTGTKKGVERAMLDPTCKACDDFYRYATGGWTDKNPIPADRSSWATFTELAEANLEREKTILDASSAAGATGDQKRLGDLFQGCMNTEAIDAAGVKPLQALFSRIDAISTRQDLVATLSSLQSDAISPVFGIGSTPDPDDAGQIIAGIDAGGLSLPDRDYYFRDDAATKKIRDAFLLHVAKLSELAGQTPSAAAATATTVFDFESALAQATLTRVQRRDPYLTTHKMSFAQTKELAPDYDWAGTFGVLNIPNGVAIDVSQPDFMRAMNKQLVSVPVETWKTWLKWRLLSGRAPSLSAAFRDESFHFNSTVLNGVAQQQPRWKQCADVANTTLGDALGRLYVDKYFPAESRRRVQELVTNMRAALGDQLKASDWLEAETRKNAVAKLEAFDARVGSTVKWRDYSNVQVSRDNYFAALESASRAGRAFNLAKIGKPVDTTQWAMTPPTVNAYYDPQRNSITFPAGILQPPFFDANADDANNYGAVGAVIGHEMGHGFDDQGAKYDAAGNLKDWWTAQDKANFEKRAACVTEQFETTDMGGGQHHNGKLVTGEAMGDLGGLTLAYKAYHKSLGGKAAPVIDGFTGDQRFFLAFARVWATNMREERARTLLATDPHPMAKYRVLLTLQNMPEFHAAFGCKPGDAMVRPVAKQCKLW